MNNVTSNSSSDDGRGNDGKAQLKDGKDGARDGRGSLDRARTQASEHVVLDGETQQLVVPGVVRPDQGERNNHPDERDDGSRQHDSLQQGGGLEVVQVHYDKNIRVKEK